MFENGWLNRRIDSTSLRDATRAGSLELERARTALRTPQSDTSRELVDDLRERIASALNVTSRCVTVDRWNLSLRSRSIRCWGSSAGTQFFAKMFLMDPYPVTPRPTIPSEEELRRSKQLRSAEDQTENEWNTANRLRALGGPDFVPALLGRSRKARTIVWKQVRGVRLYDLFERLRWADPRGKTSAAALFQAGAWLRRVHDASVGGSETLDVAAMVELIPRLMEKEGWRSSKYAHRACRLLEAARVRIGNNGKLPVPVAFNHGDFALPNLMWEREARQFFVIDFEHAGHRSICHDLLTIIFDLRARLLNPLIPKRVIQSSEESFWAGYGSIPGEISVLVDALASSRIFYYSLPRLSTRKKRRGWLAGAMASIYKALFEDTIVRRLGVTC